MPASADSFAPYLTSIEEDYRTGRATEHTYRAALQSLLQSLLPGSKATNEPKRVACGAPDYIITSSRGNNTFTLGYVEAKDVGADLEGIERDSNRAEPTTREGKQLKRYRQALPNLVFTDYLEFRWYTDGTRRSIAQLASAGQGTHHRGIRAATERLAAQGGGYI